MTIEQVYYGLTEVGAKDTFQQGKVPEFQMPRHKNSSSSSKSIVNVQCQTLPKWYENS